VSVRGLRKEFQTGSGVPKVAVDSIDVDMFEGQIFVLLGEILSAGKTLALYFRV
jgi:ABC-type oligopeptide transport system ATPase subunit